MAFNVSSFRSKLSQDGARPNLFEVTIPTKQNYWTNSNGDFRFFCRAAALPGSTIGTVTVPYFGREIKLAGNRTFADWTVTVINDEDFLFRSQFENWMSVINTHNENVRGQNAGVNSYVESSANVKQFSKNGSTVLRTYNFVSLFPIDISEITLDWGDNDSVEEFTVTFAYDYWVGSTAGTGAAGAQP